MAKGEKGTAKIERARALANEELRDAEAKAQRKIKKTRAALQSDELRFRHDSRKLSRK
jgi:hypothetical protein